MQFKLWQMFAAITVPCVLFGLYRSAFQAGEKARDYEWNMALELGGTTRPAIANILFRPQWQSSIKHCPFCNAFQSVTAGPHVAAGHGFYDWHCINCDQWFYYGSNDNGQTHYAVPLPGSVLEHPGPNADGVVHVPF